MSCQPPYFWNTDIFYLVVEIPEKKIRLLICLCICLHYAEWPCASWASFLSPEREKLRRLSRTSQWIWPRVCKHFYLLNMHNINRPWFFCDGEISCHQLSIYQCLLILFSLNFSHFCHQVYRLFMTKAWWTSMAPSPTELWSTTMEWLLPRHPSPWKSQQSDPDPLIHPQVQTTSRETEAVFLKYA